ncbi:hypothetical protein GOODEAATRI_003532 [Goodea atripinnis]|uniref:Apolipoprotein M n=1 Tax=Goodea atripinnis TaxID=208336 RepID=A0ABV0N7U6_9TELE
MMECVHVAVAVFSLLSLGQSAPATNCESLIQPIQINGRDQLLGRWTFIAESTDIPGSRVLSKMFMGNSWLSSTAATQENVITTSQNQKMFGLCFSLTYNMTLENNALVLVIPYPSTAFLLNTGCPDCMVVFTNYTIGRSLYKGLQLLSRRPKVSAAELEEYKKQVECLNLPAAAILDPENGFCPDPALSKDTKSIDLTSSFNSMGSDDMNLLDKILKSGNGVKLLNEMLSMISRNATAMMEN